MAKDYYDILGINKNASSEEIKRAFRKLAHQYHPDKGGGNEAKFKEVNEAYQVLKDPQKRQQYDQYGQTFEQARAQGGFSGFEGFRDFSDFAEAFRGNNGASYEFNFGDLGDVFGDLFGFGSTRTRTGTRTRSADIQTSINLTFKEAVFGTEKNITLTKDAVCEKCQGSGAEPGSKINTCKTCQGQGRVVKNIGFGIGMPSTCPECAGQGQRAEKHCSKCHGNGVIRQSSEIKVKMPAGIDNNQSIRLTGQGQAAAQSGQAGDLYVTVKVTSDKDFERDGFNIMSKAEISFSQAALGDKININTLDGQVRLKIPAGTQSGKVFVLRGRGVPYLHSRGRGDQLVKVIVKTPTRLSRKQKRMLEELKKEE